MAVLGFIALLAAIWLLWNISRNTADALDKQTALQYEIVALEKRLDELLERLVESERSSSENTSQVESKDLSVRSEVAEQQVEKTEQEVEAANVEGSKTNLNTASEEALTQLPKIGPATARRIIEGRPYASIDDLTKVQGISDELLNELRTKLDV